MARQGANKKKCERYKNEGRYERNKRTNLMKYIKKIRKIKEAPDWLPRLKPIPAWAKDIVR